MPPTKPDDIVEDDGNTPNEITNEHYGNLALSPVVAPPELPFVLDEQAVMDILGVSVCLLLFLQMNGLNVFI